MGRLVLATRAHDAAQSGYEVRSGRAEFIVMMEREFSEDLLSLGSERQQNFAAIVLGAGAMDEASGLQPVH